MIFNYYEKLLKFLNLNIEKIDTDYIISTCENIGITPPPQSVVLFYHYFGNYDLALKGYYHLFHLHELKIWHNALIFGVNDEKGILGIKRDDFFKTDDPSVYYGYENSDVWYSELNKKGGNAFFFNIACTNITYGKKYLAVVYMKKSDFYEKILNKCFLYSFTEDESIIKGYQRCGCYSRTGHILASYFTLTETLLVGSDQMDLLTEFFDETGWKYKLFDKNPLKRIKQKKLKQVEKIDLEQYYLLLEKYLSYLPERLDETVIESKGKQLGITFPSCFVQFYHYFGNCDEVLNSDIRFEKLQNIHVVNETVVVGYSNQQSVTYGFKIDQIDGSETFISEFADEMCMDEVRVYSGAAFYFNAACFNVVLSMHSVGQIKKSYKYFFSNIIDKRNVYSFLDNREIKKGFVMCGCHDEEHKILGCYVSDGLDSLFLGADSDETLIEFEKKSKWKIDYL